MPSKPSDQEIPDQNKTIESDPPAEDNVSDEPDALKPSPMAGKVVLQDGEELIEKTIED